MHFMETNRALQMNSLRATIVRKYLLDKGFVGMQELQITYYKLPKLQISPTSAPMRVCPVAFSNVTSFIGVASA